MYDREVLYQAIAYTNINLFETVSWEKINNIWSEQNWFGHYIQILVSWLRTTRMYSLGLL